MILIQIVDDYTRVEHARCNDMDSKDYSKLEDAKNACSLDTKCVGVYDFNCGKGVYYHCHRFEIDSVKWSRKKCVYKKQEDYGK